MNNYTISHEELEKLLDRMLEYVSHPVEGNLTYNSNDNTFIGAGTTNQKSV